MKTEGPLTALQDTKASLKETIPKQVGDYRVSKTLG